MRTKRVVGLVGIVAGLVIGFWPSLPSISTVIVPHHDIVSDIRFEMLEKIADQIDGRTILLVSPNHYKTGTADIQTRTEAFSTRFGEVEVAELANDAIELGAEVEFGGFSNEHGIYSVLPDLARLTTNSKIVPLVINEDTPPDNLNSFFDALHQKCNDCVFMASADMSHYQPYAISELHDEMTVRALSELDLPYLLDKAEIGPPKVVHQAVRWASNAQTERFELFDRTNSTELSAQPFSEGTTHIFGWYESGQQIETPKSGSFSFVGDISFAGSLYNQAETNFRDVTAALGDRVLWGTDIVMGNLEGPVTSQQGFRQLSLINDPRSLPTLDYLHFTSLATNNNHFLDAGNVGAQDTFENLERFGIDANPEGYWGVDANNIKLHILNYDATNPDEDLAQAIELFEGSNDRTIIYAHWGRELERSSSEYQRNQARSWIELGADLVVGTGTHVIGEAEIYRGVPVFYSLGNFIFDESYQDDPRGLVLSGVFYEDKITLLPSITTFLNGELLLQRDQKANDQIIEWFSDFEPYISDTTGGISFTIDSHKE